jgi:hypothetical protein
MRAKADTDISIVVEQGDALDFRANVLVLKYANASYGVDRSFAVVSSGACPAVELRVISQPS